MNATFSDLPDDIRNRLLPLKLLRQRFYVAYHPDYPRGFLRSKDDAGLAAWQSRAWDFFGNQAPTIVDVTDAIPDLLFGRASDIVVWHTALRRAKEIGKALPVLAPANAQDAQLVFRPPATLVYRAITDATLAGDVDLNMQECDFWQMCREAARGINEAVEKSAAQ